ncbi:MAG: hypothetical protein ACRC1W_00285 [Shewanella sp.]
MGKQSDIRQLLLLIRRKNEALIAAGHALEQASARLDMCGRDVLGTRFQDEAVKAHLASMELPRLSLGGCDGL